MPPPTMLIPDRALPPPRSDKSTIEYYKENTPVTIIKNWIKNRMPEFGGKVTSPSDKILLIRAKTGSGKSTAMPVEIFRMFKPKTSTDYEGKSVLVTQPRVLTSQEIPKDITSSDWAKDMILGKTIGFSTGSAKVVGERGGRSMLLYATIDTLLAQLRGENAKQTIMDLYYVIILDEVHERSMTFDMTVMLMKKFIYENYKNKNCPILLLTSATFDVEKYSKYFGIPMKTNVIDIAGFVYNISDQYLNHDTLNTMNTTLSIIKDIHEDKINVQKQGENDVLVFLYGMSPMKKLKELLLAYNIELINQKKKIFVVTIVEAKAVNFNTIERQIVYMEYNNLKVDDKGEYSSKGKHVAYRRIILASNVAETGLTIPTLGHCIDMGWKNVKELYNPYGIYGMVVKPVDKNNVTQRRGRVGRKFPGHFYAIYTEQTFNSLTSIQLPSIVLEDISNNIIDILIQQDNCFDIEKIDMLDNPPIDSLKMSIEKNITLGYLKSDYGKCFLMSDLGELSRSLNNISIEVFRSIISGYVYDICIPDLITIFSMIDVRTSYKIDIPGILKESLPPFFFESKDYMNTYTAITMDDFITLLFIFESFSKSLEKGIVYSQTFCEKHKLDFDTMIDVIEKRIKIMDELILLKFNPLYLQDKSLVNSKKDKYIKHLSIIKQCIYDGYRLNLIINDKISRNYKDRFGNITKIKSPNRNIGFPKYIITNAIKIVGNPFSETFQFNIESDKISVMDGYVPIDLQFNTPIHTLTYDDILTKNKKIEWAENNYDLHNMLSNYINSIKDNNKIDFLFSKDYL